MNSTRGKWVIAGAVAAYLIRFSLKLRSFLSKKNAILSQGLRKRTQVKASIISSSASLPQLSPQLSTKLLNSTVTQLVALRDSREVSCAEIVLAFIHQTAEWDERLGLAVDERLIEAYQEALECDKALARGESKGVLTGIPFSVKDVIAVKDQVTAFGCASHSFNIPQEDNVIISLLKSSGAIILFKSAMGLLGADYETCNRIVGETKNPWDESRVPGGSSGGDSAAVSARAVPWGLGSDVGGSVRTPAAYCGLYTIKTSYNRLTGLGPIPRPGYPNLYTSYGPLTKCVEDLTLILKTLCSAAMYAADPLIPPIPWAQSEYESTAKRRIGVFTDNTFWPITSANKRVLMEAADALRGLGHEIVPFDLGDMRELCELACAMIFTPSEGALKMKEEPPLSHHKHIVVVKLTPPWLRGVGEWWCGKSFAAVPWKTLKDPRIQTYICNNNRILTLRDQFLRRMQDAGLDALLMPYATPAFQHHLTPWNHYTGTFTVFANLFDLPAGSVPIGLVRAEEQTFPATGDWHIDSGQRVMQGAAGLPLGVQVVTYRYQEERCLGIMKQLQDCFKFEECPPAVKAKMG